MKITHKKDKIIIELDLWQSGKYTYGDGKWKVRNLLGIIAGDEMTISQASYLDYKDDLQEGAPLLHYYGDKEDFIKLCKKLDIDIWNHPICAYCNKPIRGCFGLGDKGNQCGGCEYKNEKR